MAYLRVRASIGAAAILLLAWATSACGGDDDYGPASTTASSSSSGAAITVRDAGTLGKILSDGSGMTLYTFKSDSPGSGKSACTGSCVSTWPPLTTTASSVTRPEGVPGDLGIITRDDGAKQVTYQGQPLYRYAGDRAPGDTTGHGIGQVWFVAALQASAGATETPSTYYNY